jgi:hypothetical protein
VLVVLELLDRVTQVAAPLITEETNGLVVVVVAHLL